MKHTLKAKIIMSLLAIMIIFAMTGCMSLTETIQIKSDGSAEVEGTMLINRKAYIDTMKQFYADSKTDSEIEKEVDKSMADDEYTKVTIDGTKYYKKVENESLDNKGFLKMLNDDSDNGYATGEVFYWSTVVSSKDAGTNIKPTDTDDIGIKATIIVNFDAPIVNTNGTIADDNPNQVIFDVPLDKSVTLFATTNESITKESIEKKIKDLNKIGKTKILKLKALKNKKSSKTASLQLVFKKVPNATSYEIQYDTSSKFKTPITKIVKKPNLKLKNLAKNKKYYIRIRSAKKNYAGKTVYSKWTKKSIRTKNKN